MVKWIVRQSWLCLTGVFYAVVGFVEVLQGPVGSLGIGESFMDYCSSIFTVQMLSDSEPTVSRPWCGTADALTENSVIFRDYCYFEASIFAKLTFLTSGWWLLCCQVRKALVSSQCFVLRTRQRFTPMVFTSGLMWTRVHWGTSCHTGSTAISLMLTSK